jgi:hypothetical protein
VQKSVIMAALFLLVAGGVQAEELISCKGDITSIQGEGLVARTHRFEVTDVTGSDLLVVLEKCRKIAQERQNRAAQKSQAGNFRPVSNLQLECLKGTEKFEVRRSINTAK